MANFNSVQNIVIDSILPVYGDNQPRKVMPVWDEGQKMFIMSEYESAAGNRYIQGLRFSNRLAVVEEVGLYHTWKYIDGLKVYSWNGTSKRLIGSRKYVRHFYDADFIRQELEDIVKSHIEGQLKLQQQPVDKDAIMAQAHALTNMCYISFLSDDFETNLHELIPLLAANTNN